MRDEKPSRPPNPNVATRPNRYLAVHGGYWRVSMAVPKELQAELGTRLIRGLNTTSVSIARIKREPIVREFKDAIEAAWAARGGKKRSLMAEALEVRGMLQDADPNMEDFLQQGIDERVEEILSEGATWTTEVNEDGEVDVRRPTEEAEEKARQFRGLAAGFRTPIGGHLHDEFMRSLKISDRSKLDEPRALGLFVQFLRSRHLPIPPEIEQITKREAVQFMDWLDQSDELSWASKAKYFGRIKFYWAWLSKREHAKENPFRDLTIEKPKTQREDDERPYTDTEIQRLLMGSPREGDGMLDVMKLAALTGARLDAVIDLQVGNLAKGYFTFKAQKKERGGRDVPVHPALGEIVARRIRGKAPGDPLFEDWPGPKPPSVKPRSAYFSKRYTKYSSDIGVRDEVEGKRRSLVNFHSFRRWFITKLERARVREPLIAAIVGHKRPGLTLGLYSGGPEFEEAKEAIALVQLPPLDGTVIEEERVLMPRRRKPE